MLEPFIDNKTFPDGRVILYMPFSSPLDDQLDLVSSLWETLSGQYPNMFLIRDTLTIKVIVRPNYVFASMGSFLEDCPQAKHDNPAVQNANYIYLSLVSLINFWALYCDRDIIKIYA